VALLDEVVDQFARRVIHFHIERFHATGEVIESHNGRDGDQEAESGGDQGFRDAAGNRADTRGLLGGDLLEGVQNADNRALGTLSCLRRFFLFSSTSALL